MSKKTTQDLEKIRPEYEQVLSLLNPSSIEDSLNEIEYDFELLKTAVFAQFSSRINSQAECEKELEGLKATKSFDKVTLEDLKNCPMLFAYFSELNKTMVNLEKVKEKRLKAEKKKRRVYELTLEKYAEIKEAVDWFSSFTFQDKVRVIRLMLKQDELSEALDNVLKAHLLFDKTKDLSRIRDFTELVSFLYDQINERKRNQSW